MGYHHGVRDPVKKQAGTAHRSHSSAAAHTTFFFDG
jgi:hypothetical protein